MQSETVNNKYQHTLESIFQSPLPSHLKWHDIITPFEHIGAVKFKSNGQLTFTVNGTPRIFHQAKGQEISDSSQIQDLRDFLESVGMGQNSALDGKETLRLLVAITQKETLVFRSEVKGTVPERLHPYDPHGTLRQLKHTRGTTAGAHAPENLVQSGINLILVMP